MGFNYTFFCLLYVCAHLIEGGFFLLNITGIFKNRVLNTAHLLAFGFAMENEAYTISCAILDNQFQMNVAITDTGEISVKVLDTDNQEEYILVHVSDASGTFVGAVIQACEEYLKIIAEKCFDYMVFKSEQTKQLIAYADKTYQSQLEFLWTKFPNNAVFRRKDAGKWYAAILTISKAKLGLEGTETIEVIDLRALPDEIEQLIDGEKYFPGYHMNKKHWYTICLDGSVSTQEICRRIDTSYSLTNSQKVSLSYHL